VLQRYIDQTQAIIRDTQGLFVPLNTLISYINEARETTAELTGCIEVLVAGTPPFGTGAQAGTAIVGGAIPGQNPNSTFQTINGQECYPFQGFANPYLKAQYGGAKGIIDVVTVSVSWGGAFRPSLDWMPWEEFQSQLRANQILVTTYPSVFSVLNAGENGQVYLFPVPQGSNEMEWQCLVQPAPIYTDSDPELIPSPFRNAIQYYAAGKCYEASQRNGQAQLMYGRWADMCGLNRGAADRGKVPSRYPLAI